MCIAFITVGGYFVKYRLDIRFEINRNRVQAAQKFRNCFLKELKGLYPLPIEWPGISAAIAPRLQSVFSELQIAVAEFRPFIPWYRRWLFDRAWFRYRYAYEQEGGYQCYHHYMAFEDNPKYKEIFRHNIDKLLSFAKYH